MKNDLTKVPTATLQTGIKQLNTISKIITAGYIAVFAVVFWSWIKLETNTAFLALLPVTLGCGMMLSSLMKNKGAKEEELRRRS